MEQELITFGLEVAGSIAMGTVICHHLLSWHLRLGFEENIALAVFGLAQWKSGSDSLH